MIPRFQNPHLLPQRSTQATRAKIFNVDEDNEEGGIVNDDLDYVVHIQQLKALVHRFLGDISTDHAEEQKIGSKRKRSLVPDDAMPFRLVSSSLPPKVISLSPKPPPPSKIREPDCEDTEAQAVQRMRRAESTAVDIDWILRQSAVAHTSRHRRTDTVVLPISFGFPNPDPPLLLIPKYPSRMSPRRRSPTMEQHHLCNRPHNEAKTGYLCIPPVQVSLSRDGDRRRRCKKVQKERPPARFWRPDPFMGGKSAGYAWGY